MNEDQSNHQKKSAEIVLKSANVLASASDALARYYGQLAEYEKKRAEMISLFSQMKPIRISATVKYGSVEDNIEADHSDETSTPEVKVCPEIVCESDEQDAVSESSQAESEAERIVRAGTSDEKRLNFLQFYLENADVIRGVMFCGTLQFSTCLLCAALDGHIWKNPDELHLVPVVPLHQDCRCVLLPVTDMHEINRSKRPAEASDFWHDAAVRYAQQYPKKSWNKLSASTKLKYYYQEQKLFEQETGHPAFDEVPQNMNFSDWLRTRPEELQTRYLGELRAKLFREHNLNLIDFVDQTTWTLFPDDALISKYITSPCTERKNHV